MKRILTATVKSANLIPLVVILLFIRENKTHRMASSAWYKTCGNTCRQIFTLSANTFTTSGVIQAYIKTSSGTFTPLWSNSTCSTPVMFTGC